MASNIDPSHPQSGTAFTANVRDNFAAAKAEIEELQLSHGFADYNADTSSIAVSANNWTNLTNDAAGAFTKTDALPNGVTSLWDSAANQFDFSELPVNSEAILRADLGVTTTAANQVVKFRLRMAIGDAIEYSLNIQESGFKASGAHDMTPIIPFYIGSTQVKNNPAQLEIQSDGTATVVVRGWYISVRKAL